MRVCQCVYVCVCVCVCVDSYFDFFPFFLFCFLKLCVCFIMCAQHLNRLRWWCTVSFLLLFHFTTSCFVVYQKAKPFFGWFSSFSILVFFFVWSACCTCVSWSSTHIHSYNSTLLWFFCGGFQKPEKSKREKNLCLLHILLPLPFFLSHIYACVCVYM